MPETQQPRRIFYRDKKENVEEFIKYAAAYGTIDDVLTANQELTEYYRSTCTGQDENFGILKWVNDCQDKLDEKMQELEEHEVRNWGNLKGREWHQYCRERRLSVLTSIGMEERFAKRFMKKLSKRQSQNLDWIWTRMAIPACR